MSEHIVNALPPHGLTPVKPDAATLALLWPRRLKPIWAGMCIITRDKNSCLSFVSRGSVPF
jgi:hypothetical protein